VDSPFVFTAVVFSATARALQARKLRSSSSTAHLQDVRSFLPRAQALRTEPSTRNRPLPVARPRAHCSHRLASHLAGGSALSPLAYIRKYIYTYIYLFIYIYIYTFILIYKYIHIYIYVPIYNYIYIYSDKYIHRYACILTYLCIYICLHIHPPTHIHMYTSPPILPCTRPSTAHHIAGISAPVADIPRYPRKASASTHTPAHPLTLNAAPSLVGCVLIDVDQLYAALHSISTSTSTPLYNI
jgi:hypothetical protein